MTDAGLTVRKRDIRTAFTATATAAPIMLRAVQWPVPVRVAAALLRLKQRGVDIANEIEAFRVGLCEARADKDESGAPVLVDGNYRIAPAEVEAIQAELNALLDQSVTLPDCRAVTLAELGDAVQVTADDLERLGPFVVEG